MMDIDRLLTELGNEIVYPESPDLVDAVSRRIGSHTSPPARLQGWAPRVVIIATLLVVVVLIVPGTRDEVASWLGLRGLTIVDEPRSLAGSELGLGIETTLEEAERIAGFQPRTSALLGKPDRVYVESGRIWMVYVARADLPETDVAGVGAIVAQFPFSESPGLTKTVLGGEDSSILVEVGSDFGVWIEGPHDLILDQESEHQRRTAASALLWESGDITLRIEVDLPLSEVLRLAESFR